MRSVNFSVLFFRCAPGILLLSMPIAAPAQPESVPEYGLFEAGFPVTTDYENPFDSSNISVDAEIQSDSGTSFRVPCFYDGDGTWKVRFTPREEGIYIYRVIAKTKQETVEVYSGEFQVTPRPHRGFVRTAAESPRHFVFENGESYFPLGENLGWVNPPTLATWNGYLRECEEAGINWIRIWMCPWGMTELEWTGRGYHGLGTYSLANARMIDGIFREAEQRGIYIQLVINHHGQYSSQTNPIWGQNPYNSKNGGFLKRPSEFFTDSEAQRHYRDRLRYLVGRWGYSTHLLAWEFWNEVNLTSGFDFPVVKRWHEDMASYLRSIDPYDHLMTTSAAGDFRDIYTIEGLDYLQTHAYVTNIIEKLMETSKANWQEYPGRPHFFGEMSYDYRGPNIGDRDGVILHNQLWASVQSWDSGTSMTWWWDNWVRPYNLYSHFKILSRYINGIDWVKENLVPLDAHVEPREENVGDFIFVPGLGWSRANRVEFIVRPDGIVENLNECSVYVHGQYHPEMGPNPVFLVTASRPTRFGMRIERVARSGAVCMILLNRERVIRRVFEPRSSDYSPGEDGNISFDVPSGSHRISVRNTGLDWFQVGHYRIENYVQRPVAYARGNGNLILLWIHDRPHQYATLSEYDKYGPIQETNVTITNIRDGEFTAEQFDTYSGDTTSLPNIRATEDGLSFELPAFKRDIAFRLERVVSSVGNQSPR